VKKTPCLKNASAPENPTSALLPPAASVVCSWTSKCSALYCAFSKSDFWPPPTWAVAVYASWPGEFAAELVYETAVVVCPPVSDVCACRYPVRPTLSATATPAVHVFCSAPGALGAPVFGGNALSVKNDPRLRASETVQLSWPPVRKLSSLVS
jgi:hypothetical protein